MEELYTVTISLEDESTARDLLQGQGYVAGYDFQFLYYEDSIAVELFNDSVPVSYTHLTLPTKRIV